MLKNLFKPKWQSPKPEIRIAAIAQLNPNKHEDRLTLVQLAKHDINRDVRRAAILHLNELKTLIGLLHQNQHDPLKEVICQCLSKVICTGEIPPKKESVKERIIALSLINEPAIFNFIIANCSELDIQLAALDRITDQNTFKSLTMTAPVVAIRMRAVERLEGVEPLEWVIEQTKSENDPVYQLARSRLATIYAATNKRQQSIAECKRVCVAVENLSTSPVDEQYESTLKSLVEQWQALDREYRFSFATRVYNARVNCTQAIDAYHAQKLRQHNEAIKEQRETCKVLEETIAFIKRSTGDREADLPSIQGLLTTQQIRWEEASNTARPDPTILRRYETAEKNLINYLIATRQQEQATSDQLAI